MRLPVVRRALAVLGLSLAACGGPADEADLGQSQQAVTASTCQQYGVIDQGEYKVQQDEWNSTATQCISSTGANFTVTSANFNVTSGAPATYPSIFKGCHWGNCTPNSGMPVQVSAIGSATSSVSFTIPSNTIYDAAYDLWYNSSPTTSGQPNGAEVMIWVSHAGFPNPVGSRVASGVWISGASWDVWFGNSGWNVISYVRTQPATSASVDLKAFTNDSVARGYIQRAWYLIAIECGFEIWKGGQGMAVTSFSASVTSGSNNGGGGGGNTGGGGGAGCTTVSGGQSGNFNTTGAVCYTVNATIHGWGCSNADGRTVSVNGANVSCGQSLSGSPPYTFRFTGGAVPWTSFYWW
jgi:cellulose 1,4-beta-cellobiosidase